MVRELIGTALTRRLILRIKPPAGLQVITRAEQRDKTVGFKTCRSLWNYRYDATMTLKSINTEQARFIYSANTIIGTSKCNGVFELPNHRSDYGTSEKKIICSKDLRVHFAYKRPEPADVRFHAPGSGQAVTTQRGRSINTKYHVSQELIFTARR
jgi:hypothetical protein